MRDYHDINVWEKSHELTLAIYKVSEDFPQNEQFSLTSQIRRACSSIPMNIAEGCGKSSEAEFCRYLDISAGSASELDYQLLLAKDLGYIKETDYQDLAERLNHIIRMLTNLIKSVRAKKS
jgi:four helix bundle protein